MILTTTKCVKRFIKTTEVNPKKKKKCILIYKVSVSSVSITLMLSVETDCSFVGSTKFKQTPDD